MSRSSHNGWRLVPGSGFAGQPWTLRVFTLCFYAYAAVVLFRAGALARLAGQPVAGSAVIVVCGWVLFYALGVLPAVLGGSARRSAADAIRRFECNRLAVLGLALFLAILAVTLLAPLLSPYVPSEQAQPALERYQPPSREHLMGTDKFGRDVMSRVIYGSRISLSVGLISVVIASILGLIYGAFAGYAGGWLDDLAMRLVDGLLAFPRLLLLLTLLAFFTNSFWLVVFVLSATGWMWVARLVRAQVILLKQQDFVQAAIATGVGHRRLVWKHIVPNALGPVILTAALRVGTVILLESYLSFLGLGVQPPTPSWGNMVFEGRDVLLSAWWVSAFPALAIVGAVVSCNLLGDGLRDAFDVRGGHA